MNRIIEKEKIDLGLLPQALNDSNVTGKYFNLKRYRKAAFVLLIGAMAASETATLEILQAKTVAGGSAKGIPGDGDDSLAKAVVTANTKVISATIALATAANTDKVTVNGIEFTMAAATSTANKTFADAAGLVTLINAFCPGVIASAQTTTVTVQTNDGGADVTVAKVEVAGTITLATVAALAIVELDARYLDLDNDFAYVAPKVATTANSVVSVAVIRGAARFNPGRIGAVTVK